MQLMASFHEILASAPPRPDQPKTNAPYYGWEVERRLTHPPAVMQSISPTDVTPLRISRAMQGLPVFSDTSPAEGELVFDDSRQDLPTANFRDLAREGVSRRTRKLQKNQGGRSPQHHGNNRNGRRR